MGNLYLMAGMLIVAMFFTGSEMGAYCINRLRLRFRVGEGVPGAEMLSDMLADRETLVSTTLAGTNMSYYVATACLTAMFVNAEVKNAELWSTVVLAPLLLVCTEIFPKTIFTMHANALMYRLVWLLRGAKILLWPMAIVLKGVMVTFDSIFGKSEPEGLGRLSLPRLEGFISEGRSEGVISAEQDRMARNVMQLEKITLRDVMIPLDDVTALPVSATGEDVRRLAAEHAYSRLPVYDGDRANIAGVIGLVEYLSDSDGPDAPIREFVRPGLHLPETMPIDSALLRLRRGKETMGLVVTDDDRVIGTVTLKDLVEEIVGELAAW